MFPQDGSKAQYYQGKELWTQLVMEEVFVHGKLKHHYHGVSRTQCQRKAKDILRKVD